MVVFSLGLGFGLGQEQVCFKASLSADSFSSSVSRALVSAGRGVVGRWVFVMLFVGGVGALQTLGLIVTLLNDGLLVLLVVSDCGNWDIPM